MLSEQALRELLAYHPPAPVLSVFLSTATGADSAEAYKLRLRKLLEPFSRQAPVDVDAIQTYIEHAYDWSGQSIALFSCKEDNFFKAFPLALELRERARLLPRPYVKPLADLLDQYGHYGIALVDQQSVRLLICHLGSIEKEHTEVGEAIRRIKFGGGSQAMGRKGGDAGIDRSQETISVRNLKRLAARSAAFFRENKARRILVGGTEEITGRFLEQLPKRWRSLTAATFPIDINADHTEIRRRAHHASREAQRKQERKLIELVITGAAKGRGGVVRLDDTLSAVRNGSVQTLIIKEGFRAPGYRCYGCEYLTSQALSICPFCGGSFAEIEDAVEMAVQQVLRDGGTVSVVHESADLEGAGKIGALLRY